MKVHQIYTESPLRNFTYLIDDGQGSIYCIDPYSEELVLDYLNNIEGTLKAVINTHEHGDHTGGNEGLKNITQCEVWAHQNAKGQIPDIDRFLSGGENIVLNQEWTLGVLDTPGHTFAHLCLLLSNQGNVEAVFTGDTLFNAGVGNCHNGGDPEVLYETIHQQFQNLPDQVLVYPGHDYLENNLKFTMDREPSNVIAEAILKTEKTSQDDLFLVTNMKLEREVNTFLRLDQKEIISNLNLTTATNKQVFLSLRELRNKW
jgi:hydroxyacylglutathione hydrolase